MRRELNSNFNSVFVTLIDTLSAALIKLSYTKLLDFPSGTLAYRHPYLYANVTFQVESRQEYHTIAQLPEIK